VTDYKNTVIFNYIATFANIATGLILFPIIVNNLGYEKLGVFSLLFSIKAIADIGVGWMGGSFVKHYISHEISESKINKCADAFLFSNILYALYSVLLIIILSVYFIGWKPEVELLTLAGFTLYIFSCFMMRPIFEVFTASLSQCKVAKFRCVQQLLFLLTSIASIILYQSIPLLFVMAGITSLIMVLALNIHNKSYFSTLSLPSKILVKKLMITDGKSYALFGISLICMLQIDIIALDILYGSATVALFSIAWRVPNTIIQLAWRLSEPMAAIVGRKMQENDPKLKEMLKNNQFKMIGVAVFSCVGYYFCIDIFLFWWMPSYDMEQFYYFKEITTFSIFVLIIVKFYADLLFYQKECIFSGFTFLGVAVIKVIGIVFLYSIFGSLASLVTMSIFILLVSIPLHINWLIKKL